VHLCRMRGTKCAHVVEASDVPVVSNSDGEDDDDTPQKPILLQGLLHISVELPSPTRPKKDAHKEPMVATDDVCTHFIDCDTLSNPFR
jgi:hypothetical protein